MPERPSFLWVGAIIALTLSLCGCVGAGSDVPLLENQEARFSWRVDTSDVRPGIWFNEYIYWIVDTPHEEYIDRDMLLRISISTGEVEHIGTEWPTWCHRKLRILGMAAYGDGWILASTCTGEYYRSRYFIAISDFGDVDDLRIEELDVPLSGGLSVYGDYLMYTDVSGVTPFTRFMDLRTFEEIDDRNLPGTLTAQYSPDGQAIVVWAEPTLAFNQPIYIDPWWRPERWRLVVYDVNLKYLRDILYTNSDSSRPIWVPDSRYVVVSADINKGTQLLLVNTETGSSIPLLDYHKDALVSPDGSQIALFFQGGRATSSQIKVFDLPID